MPAISRGASTSSSASPGPIEVIVADNGSSDGSAGVATELGATVVDASERAGPNHARNAGAARASGDVVLVCDADDVVDERWVGAMVAALSEFDLVGGTMERTKINDVGPHWAPIRGPGELLFSFLPSALGANLGVRARVLDEIGGWDEAFAGGPDDVDFSWRAQLAGFSLGFEPAAVVYYRLRPTTAGIWRQTYRRASFLPMLFKRYGGRGLSAGPRLAKGSRYLLFVLASWPVALLSSRWRREWVRRAAFVVGFTRGLLRRVPDPILAPGFVNDRDAADAG